MSYPTDDTNGPTPGPQAEGDARPVAEDTIGLMGDTPSWAPGDPADPQVHDLACPHDDLHLDEMGEAPSHVLERRLIEAWNAEP